LCLYIESFDVTEALESLHVDKIDVVVVTLLRDTLGYTIDSIGSSIPSPRLILITKRGRTIGELRNEGLSIASSEFVCFVDDDIIVNKEWFRKLMTFLKSNENIDVAFGKIREGYTLGCSIFRTSRLKKVGGFPMIDTRVTDRVTFAIVKDSYCDHVIKPLDPILHTVRWMNHGFGTELRFGLNNNPRTSVQLFFRFLFRKKPAYAASYVLWLIKGLITYPIGLLF